jgi:hypothetical protein
MEGRKPMAQILKGFFYEFHAERVVSRAGQPITTVVGAEIGPQISRQDAVRQVRNGKDVYTLNREDAYKLATQLYAGRPVQDDPHGQFYYCHFHPGGAHPELDHDRPGRRRAIAGPGHVFFGGRGENFRARGG